MSCCFKLGVSFQLVTMKVAVRNQYYLHVCAVFDGLGDVSAYSY